MRHPSDFGGISFESGEDPDLQVAMYQAYQDFASKKNEEARKQDQLAMVRDIPIETNPTISRSSDVCICRY